MKLSIIVPVYKVEPYLRRCVDSILAQTFTDFELILVDDGSPDNCPAICDEYAEKDSRIIVIHKENGGLSDARNAGLDIAQGDYIGFVDSDDFIHPQMYEILLHFAISDNADMVQCQFYRFSENQCRPIIAQYQLNTICSKTVDSDVLLSQYYSSSCIEFSTTVCNKLYKAKIFNGIRFPVGKYYEDSYIHLDTIDVSETVSILPTPLYYYLQREGSIMHSNYTPKWFQGTINNNNNNIQFFRKKLLPEQIDYALNDFLTRFCKEKLAVYILHPEYKKEFRDVEKIYKKEFWSLMKNSKICRMKKVLAISLQISPKLAFRIAKHYFPECLHEFMR